MRHAPLAMTPDEFRSLGHRLVDRIAEHLRTLPERPVTHGEPPSDVRDALGASRRIPDKGEDGAAALEWAERTCSVRCEAVRKFCTSAGLTA